ncbi:hypothetical protein SLA2020_270320 [Shorea laevis]
MLRRTSKLFTFGREGSQELPDPVEEDSAPQGLLLGSWLPVGLLYHARLALGTRGRVDLSKLKWDEQRAPPRAILGRERLFKEECPTAFEAE